MIISDFKAIYQSLSALASTVVDSVLLLVLASVLFYDPAICSLSVMKFLQYFMPFIVCLGDLSILLLFTDIYS